MTMTDKIEYNHKRTSPYQKILAIRNNKVSTYDIIKKLNLRKRSILETGVSIDQAIREQLEPHLVKALELISS